ncbi:helix-turn-helix domain-containing protein [Hymenobacter busanensis]|uniref:Helix-turn-helix domain-containing protein n=1 Tax=Hymenobacter busanensis TaxID=2607656 RepID=A0A7L4ZSN9_9BACT|nr:helix-turn-helix domain-containing protein [Hymenobacter busanensis]KAA9327247.1 helix-turn-helix domain-containing protein [Hymenobacter busanensis]QHJ05913.1 helix-turn-helix domain-containing protein [Hymenobacter busanensis]
MNDYLIHLSLADAEQLITDCVTRALARAASTNNPTVPATPGALLGMKDVCQLLTISRPTCYKWMDAGRLPFYRKGRRLYFKYSEVMASLEKPKRRLV